MLSIEMGTMRCKKCIAWPFTQLVHTILDDEDKAVLTLDLEGVATAADGRGALSGLL
jgi:hypothetical protein